MLKGMIETVDGLRDVCDVRLLSILPVFFLHLLTDRSAMDGTLRMHLTKSRRFYDINFSLSSKGIQQVMKNVALSLPMRVLRR